MEVSSNQNLDVNVNRLSPNSRTFSKKVQSANKSTVSDIRFDPVINLDNKGFVIVDGVKLRLDAPRGTYVNLIV